MLTYFLLSAFAAAFLGFFSGLGVGGGNLMVLWLTNIMHFPTATVRGINLVFFLAAAASAALFRFRKINIPFSKLLIAAAFGCISALIVSASSVNLETTILRKCFGILLLFCGIRELFVFYKSSRSKSGN